MTMTKKKKEEEEEDDDDVVFLGENITEQHRDDGQSESIAKNGSELDRTGRCLLLVWPGGEKGLGVCLRNDEEKDVAMVRIVAYSGASEPIPCSAVGTSPPTRGMDLAIVHNPYDWDLETTGLPRRNGYIPFTSNKGKLDGHTKGNRMVSRPLGACKHSCWTYWGSSGAPLFGIHDWCIYSLHNSWNPDDAQRHAVAWEALSAFVYQ